VRSSRRLEGERQRNVEVMWLSGRLQPDYKLIAEFRRMHSQAVTEAGAELVRLARSVGLVKGDTVAVDGSKFRAVSSAKRVREREAMKHYLEQLDAADEQDEVVIDPSAVQAALEKLRNDPEPEARFMRMGRGHAPAYNVQTVVDAEHALIVAHKITDTAGDNSLLLPMAEAAREALGHPESLHVVADAGYSKGEQAEACEAQGIVPHVPLTRAVNNQGGWHAVRPQPVPLRREDGHLPLSSEPDTDTQTTLPQRSCCVRCSETGSLRCRCSEDALYEPPATSRLASSARRRLPTHAAASDPGNDASATIDGGASLCLAEVPHLRTSTLPAVRTKRRQTEISLATMVYN
jgi:hypothetical protein